MQVQGLIDGAVEGIRPEPRLFLDEWADQHRYLSPTPTAEPGRWRTDRVPYMREPMRKLSAGDPTEEIVVMKGSQVAFTEVLFTWLGYIIDNAPGPSMLVQPTETDIKKNSKMRFDPMVDATPRLKEKVSRPRSRASSNSMFQKDFPGGTLILTGANSASGLKSTPVRYLALDEIDEYPDDLDGQGNPIDLARVRQRTFRKKKRLLGSTPTVDGTSSIQAEFEETDQRYYHVPCPHCGHEQRLEFGSDKEYGLKWEKGKPETALYFCAGCGTGIEERYKTQMLSAGKWIPARPDKSSPRKAGYHLSSLYSPYGWYSWVEAAEEWEKAQADVNKLKVFLNTVLGEVWVEKGEAPDWQNLYDRRETYDLNKPPKEVAFITVGVDVQKDRLELEVVGWCKGKRTYSLDYRILPGDTAKQQVWNELAEVVSETWEREDGIILPMTRMGVDTGYNTSYAYDFCRRFPQTKVIPVKGEDRATILGMPKSVDTTSQGKKLKNLQLWPVGVGLLKSELYGWLRSREDDEGNLPPGYCHFPQYDRDYFRGLTAEQLQIEKDRRGFKKYTWVKKVERNEPLDCRIYARAAAAHLGIDRFTDDHYDKMVASYAPKSKPDPKRSKRKVKDSIWD